MRSATFLFVAAGLMLLLDAYVFQGLKAVAAGSRLKPYLYSGYWVVSLLVLVLLLVLPYLQLDNYSKGLRTTVFALLAAFFFGQLVCSLFLLADDMRRFLQWAAGKLFFSQTEGEQIQEGDSISRSAFLSWLGLGAGGAIFGSLVLGFTNKYNYQVKRVALSFPNLPAAFKGLKIIQISDIHSGSLRDRAAVRRGMETILGLQPDLILFTGDLVNNTADEMDNFMDIFSLLKAPLGVFSVLGNHDYGDYVQWPDEAGGRSELKRRNLERLKQVHAELGWKLLMNEHVVFQREAEKIALIGIENWGAKARFPKHGRLAEAHAGTEDLPFKILMSHDPSHWDAEVRPKFPDIDLMLAGHTHGMQFGVELPWFRWSPVQYMYQQWAGLYENHSQKLYVNRGFGFLGYPGRVGILPEITLLELA
ncbi:metallophosphoesterase [Paraflavisolibacter sp. H34]|uniref:metallophosphoesterase n=1 Tax=Huijunlia imazamoxiresistens TaxID=3127457 RepID=UPI00301B599B